MRLGGSVVEIYRQEEVGAVRYLMFVVVLAVVVRAHLDRTTLTEDRTLWVEMVTKNTVLNATRPNT